MFRYGIHLVSHFYALNCSSFSFFLRFVCLIRIFFFHSLVLFFFLLSFMGNSRCVKNQSLSTCYTRPPYGYDDISLSLNSNAACRPSSSASFAAVAHTHTYTPTYTHWQTYDDVIAAVFNSTTREGGGGLHSPCLLSKALYTVYTQT